MFQKGLLTLMKNTPILTALKGIIIGGTMLVPGVSGGSMAMILGIYDRLITSVSSFTRRKKENLAFLIIFSLSGILGILLFASPLLRLIERYPMPMLYFFLGAVAAGPADHKAVRGPESKLALRSLSHSRAYDSLPVCTHTLVRLSVRDDSRTCGILSPYGGRVHRGGGACPPRHQRLLSSPAHGNLR